MSRTFEEVWAEKEMQGFRYGPDALENVRLGYELGLAEAAKVIGAAVKYPEEWDTAAYPTLESAVAETHHAATCDHTFEDDRCAKCGGVA